MYVQEAINERRAYLSLDPVEINEELVKKLAESADRSNPVLSEKQVEAEKTRPERLPIEEFAQIK